MEEKRLDGDFVGQDASVGLVLERSGFFFNGRFLPYLSGLVAEGDRRSFFSDVENALLRRLGGSPSPSLLEASDRLAARDIAESIGFHRSRPSSSGGAGAAPFVAIFRNRALLRGDVDGGNGEVISLSDARRLYRLTNTSEGL